MSVNFCLLLYNSGTARIMATKISLVANQTLDYVFSMIINLCEKEKDLGIFFFFLDKEEKEIILKMLA